MRTRVQVKEIRIEEYDELLVVFTYTTQLGQVHLRLHRISQKYIGATGVQGSMTGGVPADHREL